MPHLRLCQITRTNSRDCQDPVPEDFPMDMCEMHALMATALMLERGGATVKRLTSMYDPGFVPRVTSPNETPNPPMIVDGSPSVVYYLRHGDMVKIGTTRSLAGRLKSLRYDELLAVEPGSFKQEKFRHEQFATIRADGEWFRRCAELDGHIDYIVKLYGRPHDAHQRWLTAA